MCINLQIYMRQWIKRGDKRRKGIKEDKTKIFRAIVLEEIIHDLHAGSKTWVWMTAQWTLCVEMLLIPLPEVSILRPAKIVYLLVSFIKMQPVTGHSYVKRLTVSTSKTLSYELWAMPDTLIWAWKYKSHLHCSGNNLRPWCYDTDGPDPGLIYSFLRFVSRQKYSPQ